jgi:hypothetical protein
MIVSMATRLQFLAKTNVKSAYDKKGDDDSNKDEIVHRFSSGFSQKRE